MRPRTVAVLGAWALLLAARAWGAGGTLTDGAVSLSYPITHWSANPMADLTGTETTPLGDTVYESGWWYRAQGDTHEYPLPPPDTELYNGADLLAIWNNLGGKGFQVYLYEHLFDDEGPSGAVWSHLSVMNNNATPQTFVTFHYLDMETGGTSAGDSGQALSGSYLKFTDGSNVVRYRAFLPAHHMVRSASQIRTLLNDASVNDLDDTGLPFGPGDASAAFEFDLGYPIPPGATYGGGAVAFSSRLPRDHVKGAYDDMTPYPCLLYRDLAASSNGVRCMRRTSMLPTITTFSVSPFVLQGADDFAGSLTNLTVDRDLATGETRVDFLTITGAPVLPLNWKLSATGDFNYDGKADLLWRNTSSQKLVVWSMNGRAKTGALIPSPDQAVDANWEVSGAADFNGDGWRDLLWYNQTSGKIVIWSLNAALQRITGTFTTPPSVGNNNWRVVAVGDFGKGAGGVLDSQDIVWQNDTSRKIVVWNMDRNATRTAGSFTTPDSVGADKVVVGPR